MLTNSSESDREELLQSWRNAFKQAADFDTWGQPVEAIDVYQRLSKQLHSYCTVSSPDTFFTDQQKKILEKIAVCLDSRRKSLEANVSFQGDGITLSDLRRLEKTLENLLGVQATESHNTFPVDVSVASAQLQKLMVNSIQNPPTLNSDGIVHEGRGTILPKPFPVAGKSLLTVTVQEIGLKDTSQYLDAYITVSVRDPQGKALTCCQDTPVSSKKTDNAIAFNCDVHIQKTLESLPPGYAIFFEFKHFKPKKSAVSTRCWAFMEQDEIKEGPLALELYRKPVDVKRKSLKLFTVKPLYLHLQLRLFT